MLVVRLLGGLAVEADGEPLPLPERRHGRLVLAYLALHPGLHARGELARLLWPDVMESSARSSLRSALSSVRRALGASADRVLLDPRERIGLAGDVVVDVREVHELLGAGHLEAAAERGRGVVLQGLDADWIDTARDRHRDAMDGALAQLAAAAEAEGDLARAIQFTREQVALDPLAEASNRELIRRLAAVGDRAAALAVYARLSESFRTQLRAAPSAATRELAARVRAGDDPRAVVGWEPLGVPPALRVHVPPLLAGRDAELRELAEALEAARTGAQRVVLAGGEPGIGKTALLARFADTVAAEATVLYGRGSIAEALAGYAHAAPVERLIRELPATASQLVVLIPALERAFEPPAARADLQLGEAGRLMRLMADALLAIAADHPLVLLVDELETADPGTLRALAHLVAVSGDARLLVVVAYRDTESGRLASTLRPLRRLEATRSMTLAPLDPDAIGVLAGDPELAEALHRRSGGNPLFAHELARRGVGALGESLPERVTDLVLDELSQLSPATRRVLAAASAIGDEFALPVLVRATDATTEACLDALDDAVAARAVRELPGRVGHYAFRHPLLRETLYATLTATRRAHLHLRIAEALGDDRRAVEHLAQAGELVPAADLAGATVRAARACEAALDHDDAALLYERAVAFAERPAERARLLVALGHARRRAGAEGARDAFLQAAELAGDADVLAGAALGLCAAPDFTVSDQGLDAAAVDLLERALDGARDDALRARLLAQLAFARHGRADVAPLVARSVELARASGDPEALSAALDAAHMIRRGGGDPRERLGLVDELFAVARAHGPPERLVLAHVRRAADLFELGDFAGVRAERAALSALAEELHQPAYLWWVKLWQATEAIFTGAPEGERLAREAYATGRAVVGGAAELELGAQSFWLALEHDRLGEQGDRLYAALERYRGLPAASCALARLDAEAGRLDAAGRALAQLAGPELASLQGEAGWPIGAALLAEVCARVGDADVAARLRAAIEPAAQRWATSAFGSLCLGPLTAALALVCATAGAWEDAAGYREDALERCAEAGAAPAAARLEREYARAAAPANA